MTSRARFTQLFALVALALAIGAGCGDDSKPSAPAVVTYKITATAGPYGSIFPGGEVTVNSGQDTTLTITPSASYHILDVLVDSVSFGAITSYTFNGVVSNHTISATFEINAPYYTIERFAGTGVALIGQDGRPPLDTPLYNPIDVSFGPDGTPYLIDWNNHRVRAIEGGVVKTIIGTGELGDAPAGRADTIRVNHPTHVSFGPDGMLYLSAWHNSKVMRMDLGTKMIEVICGDGTRRFGGDGGPATAALVDLPVATAFDGAGRLFISDQANERVRMIDGTGMITTVVGTGIAGFSGDGGPATEARISLPRGQQGTPAGRIEFGPDGTLYLADTINNRVRAISPDGIIRTVAGNGQAVYGNGGGDGGPATSARLNAPTDVAVASDGTLYIADTGNSAIRRVDVNGIITTFAGVGGFSGNDGDGGRPTAAHLYYPYGVAVDADDNVYIADTYNSTIRVVRK